MKSVDPTERNVANLVAFALARALFDGLAATQRRQVVERALTHLSPEPDDSYPADRQMWMDARSLLRKLGGMAS